jgi:hypothetical protein
MTDPVDALVAHWRALNADERARGLERLADAVASEQAGEDSFAGTLLRSLDRVADHVGRTPTADDYVRSIAELREVGVEIAPRSQVIRHFGTWESAKEALNLWRTPSKMTTARRIEARFKARRMGKVWRYTPETLAETMARCVADLGRPPRVVEYDWWRQEQLELAHATGDALAHLPSASPFRKRWKTWNAALLALGYSPEWIAERLEEGVLPFEPSAGS